MNSCMNLQSMLAASATANPADVLSVKHALSDLGFYEVPEWGVSEYPDRNLFDAIRNFQKTSGLRVDGVMKPGGESEAVMKTMAETVRRQGRNGDTILAHMTPAEANLLDRVTDGGSINPVTGLLEFYYGGYGGQPAGTGSVSDATSGHDGSDNETDQARNSRGGLESYKSGKANPNNDRDNGGNSAPQTQSNQTPGGMLSTIAATTVTVNKEEQKAQDQAARQNRAGLVQQKEEDEEKEILGAIDATLNKDAPVAENKENSSLRGGYNQPQTIEDVERENKAIMDRSNQLVSEQKAQEETKVLDWGPLPPPWGPNATPPAPWNGGVKKTDVPQSPTTTPKQAEKPSISMGGGPGRYGAYALRSIVDRYMNDPEFRDYIDRNLDEFVNNRSGFDPTDFGGGPPGGFGGAPTPRRR